MAVILGGGISGLSAAFYASQCQLGKLVLLESSDRLGGWIRSVESSNGTIFETGPRTVRPRGPSGKNTLSLIDRLDLTDKLVPIPSTHPSAKNRMIYVNESLHLLPNSVRGMLQTREPFDGPLIKMFWKDLTSPKVSLADESMYSFVNRRFGKDVADNLISPMLCGICAGDAKQISVNFLMSSLFEAEQKHGSIIKGLLMNRMKKLFSKNKHNDNVKHRSLATLNDERIAEVDSRSANLAEKNRWSVWGLKGGLEQLPRRLAERLRIDNIEMRLNKPCRKITFRNDHIELEVDGKVETCSRLISSLAAKNLAPLLERQHPQLARELSAIPLVTVGVVNLEFSGKCLPMEAFGFLVPPKEKIPILGVIFDSCVFPNDTSTVLTVMMGGAWFQEYFSSSPNEEYLLKVALEQVSKILGIKASPTSHNVAILKDCIPQYVVGHRQRLNRIQNYISAHQLPLALCGSSYQGVGLNDVILSAKQAVQNTFDGWSDFYANSSKYMYGCKNDVEPVVHCNDHAFMHHYEIHNRNFDGFVLGTRL